MLHICDSSPQSMCVWIVSVHQVGMASTPCSCFMITMTCHSLQFKATSFVGQIAFCSVHGSSLSADLSTNMCTSKTMGCGLGCVSVVPKYCPCLVEGLLNQ